MNGWKMIKISDFCTTGTGGTPSRSNMERYYEGGKIPWVKSGELRETVINDTEEHITKEALQETHLKLVPAGALLLAMYGATVGRLGILGTPATTNQAICHIIPDPRIADVRYLFHLLRAQVPNIVARGVGGAQPNISQGIVKSLRIPIPTLDEQKRIADILDRAEALRGKRRAALAQLDELTQTIFIDMFGDPATNPKGWDVKTFGAEIKSVRYGTGSPPKYVEEGIPFIRATNVKNGTINSKELKSISAEDAEKLSKCKVSFGNLIVVRSGVNTGDCALVPIEYHGSCAAFDLIVELSPENSVFYNFLINSSYGKQYLTPLTRRAAQPHLNADQLRSLVFIAPPLLLKEEFARRLAAVEKLKIVHNTYLAELDELFASLQYRAFRGEL